LRRPWRVNVLMGSRYKYKIKKEYYYCTYRLPIME
jgi:hypothetical protein